MRITSIFFAFLFLSGCSAGSGIHALPASNTAVNEMSTNRVAQAVENSDIDAHIDRDESDHDRKKIRKIMKMLRKQDRANVMFIDADGSVYANHKTLLAGTMRLIALPGRRNMFTDVAGRIFSGPPDSAKPTRFDGVDMQGAENRFVSSAIRAPKFGTPGTNGGSGPYRRVYSKGGYAYVAATVHLQCSAGQITVTGPNGNAADTGYAYLGGWGVTGNSSVDAGFQHSSAFDGSVNDNFALFVKEAGNPDGFVYGTADSGIYNQYQSRFTCNQDVNMAYYVPNPGYVAIASTGNLIGGTNETVTAVDGLKDAAATNDWPIDGGGAGGIVMKRMTSIGQSDPTTGNTSDQLTDGSAFGWRYYDSNPAPLVHWYNGTLAQNGSGSNPVQWDGAVNGGAQSYPCYPGVVKVQTISGVSYATEEYDGIYADPNNPCGV